MMGHTIPSNIHWTMPPENASGRRAMQSISVTAATGSMTSVMPATAASLRDDQHREDRHPQRVNYVDDSEIGRVTRRGSAVVEASGVTAPACSVVMAPRASAIRGRSSRLPGSRGTPGTR